MVSKEVFEIVGMMDEELLLIMSIQNGVLDA